MNKYLISLSLVALLFSHSANAIRCNSKVVGKGDNQYRFHKLCGEPDFVQRKVVYISDSVTSRHVDNARYHTHDKVDLSKPDDHGIKQVSNSAVGSSRHYTTNRRHRGHNEYEVRHEREREVQIETWTYDFGPNRLVQEIRFVDGVAVSIRSRGYGLSGR